MNTIVVETHYCNMQSEICIAESECVLLVVGCLYSAGTPQSNGDMQAYQNDRECHNRRATSVGGFIFARWYNLAVQISYWHTLEDLSARNATNVGVGGGLGIEVHSTKVLHAQFQQSMLQNIGND